MSEQRVSDEELARLVRHTEGTLTAVHPVNKLITHERLVLDLRDDRESLASARARIAALEAERDEAQHDAGFWKSIVYCEQPSLPTGDDEEGRMAILRRLSFLAHAMAHPQSPQLVHELEEAMGNIISHHVIGLRFNPESGLYESPAFTAALATTTEQDTAHVED
jgi:hypothetical protein